MTTNLPKLTPICEHCFQPYPFIDAPKHKDGKCNEICVNCGTPVHPNVPCSEVIQFHNQVDAEYFDLLKLILEEGKWKKNRTGVDTLGVFGAQAKFNVDLNAFPILTTKRVWFKGIVHELLWFLRGDTNIKYLVDNDVHIWDEWAYKRYIEYCQKHPDTTYEINPGGDLGGNRWRSSWSMERFIEEIKNDANFARYWGDLGMGTYGGMWRNFPCIDPNKIDYDYVPEDNVDQIQKVLEQLKTNPDCRRMIVSAWHPYWVDHCALPPCHCMFHFNTEELTVEERWEVALKRPNFTEGWVMESKEVRPCDEDLTRLMDAFDIPKRRLNLLLYIRSNDMFLGAPFNLTSYSLLIAMVAHCAGMVSGTLTYTIGDCHIYRNHMEQVDIQLGRTPRLLPKLWLNPEVKNLFDFKYEDIKLIGYDPHPTIKADVAV